MLIAAVCFVVGAFFCSCASQYAHIKNAPSASHLIRSESLLPNPNGGIRIEGTLQGFSGPSLLNISYLFKKFFCFVSPRLKLPGVVFFGIGLIVFFDLPHSLESSDEI